ncbi:MAG: DUF1501 domain-containing protein, partial [Pirellulaceae bacterium]|nr:DUF1501 domain-containing protein [Pirellulaceae bacterium]
RSGPPELAVRYDNLLKKKSITTDEHRWGPMEHAEPHGCGSRGDPCIGKLLLLARRLCEAGCGFVTIHAGYAGVWDMHADGNNLNMTDGMDAIGYAFDHAVAAFVKDVERRGLTDKILLVCGGEMGRTPRINKRGGRDHWARLAPLLLHGGGLPGGQVIGQSDRQGGQPLADPLGPKHLISTILSTVFDAGLLRLAGGVPDSVIDLASHPRIESV